VTHTFLFYTRYEREVNKAKRSALKIMMERDESSNKHMVLCVSAIRSFGSDGGGIDASAIIAAAEGLPFIPSISINHNSDNHHDLI